MTLEQLSQAVELNSRLKYIDQVIHEAEKQGIYIDCADNDTKVRFIIGTDTFESMTERLQKAILTELEAKKQEILDRIKAL